MIWIILSKMLNEPFKYHCPCFAFLPFPPGALTEKKSVTQVPYEPVRYSTHIWYFDI